MPNNTYATLYNGLGNRLLPLICLMRLCFPRERKLYIHWTGTPVRSTFAYEGAFVGFYDLFKSIEGMEFVEENVVAERNRNPDVKDYYFHFADEKPYVIKYG